MKLKVFKAHNVGVGTVLHRSQIHYAYLEMVLLRITARVQ